MIIWKWLFALLTIFVAFEVSSFTVQMINSGTFAFYAGVLLFILTWYGELRLMMYLLSSGGNKEEEEEEEEGDEDEL